MGVSTKVVFRISEHPFKVGKLTCTDENMEPR